MRTRTLIIAAAVALFVGVVVADEVKEEIFGLSGSVFDTPDPLVPAASAGEPGENQKLGSYFEDMPPLISHQIADQLPITLEENLCLDCHHLPGEIGTEIGAEDATPVPESHYVDTRKVGGSISLTDGALKLVGARYVCTQCHAAQTDAEPLVPSTY
ncbi:MAG: hypothetical protein GY719_12975 [bacterium]|nr:hypothetical protein [bacterium]